QATDVVLDLSSTPTDSFGNPIGNLRTFYAAFSNVTIGGTATNGVFLGTNQDINFQNTTLTQLAASGGAGYVNNQFVDVATNARPPVPANPAPPSTGARGRPCRPNPAMAPASDPNSAAENALYAGWLYALVATAGDGLDGLYLTKDSGLNWTKVALNTAVGLT